MLCRHCVVHVVNYAIVPKQAQVVVVGSPADVFSAGPNDSDKLLARLQSTSVPLYNLTENMKQLNVARDVRRIQA